MNAPLRNRFEICEAVDAAARNEIYRFRYRIYVEQMGLRQKYADRVRKRVVEPLDEAARIYAAYLRCRSGLGLASRMDFAVRPILLHWLAAIIAVDLLGGQPPRLVGAPR